ncbi:MAG: M28 family peptidase [Chloroflexi bacterium]|nr:M28 family peptidase [Chloroflexota bacterium]
MFGGNAGAGDVEGPGLFAGDGQDLSGLDVAGKVLLVVPKQSFEDIARRARRAGALAVIATTGEATLRKGEGWPPNPAAIPVAQVSQNGAAALLEGSGHTRQELNDDIQAGRPLPAFPLAWSVRLAVSLAPPADVEAHNVIGVLPGAAATNRTVVVGAHYEEIGPDPDGVVYPAANDNASGTAVLVELARLLKESGFRPAANIVFAAWSGHEEGLHGSRYYVDHPPFPLAETVLYLNLDTVGQGAADELEAHTGSKARTLVDSALALLSGQGDAPPVRVADSPLGVSDDINFAAAAVPYLSLLWGGLFEDGRIHTPQDTADTVDPAKLEVTGQVAALVLLLAAR